jgi:hypothetical protein
MTNLTAEEARQLSRIVPSVPIEEYVKKIDNAILEAAWKGHFEIPAWGSLGPWALTDEEVRAIKSHYENKGFEFVLRPNGGGVLSAFDLETVLTWKEAKLNQTIESNDVTSDREALVEYLRSIKING